MSGAASTEAGERAAGEALALPPWACVSDKRREHIRRVTRLLVAWAAALQLPEDDAAAWRDVGLWHDALRDAPEAELRALVPDWDAPAEMLHGPAVAARLERAGERRTEVLESIRWHTTGRADWCRTGRALYMADFLEPGRKFSRADREFLAALVPRDFDGVFRQVVRVRLEWALREGHALMPETVALWNSVR